MTSAASTGGAADTAYDAVIVGAGAGGAAAAWALSSQGLRVLVLEAGPHFEPGTDYKLDQPDWERQPFPADKARHAGRTTFAALQSLAPEWDGLRSWNAVHGQLNAGPRRLAFAYHHVRGVGGSTLHFTGEAHRLHAQALRMRTRFGVAADWPLSYAELEPFYEQAERLVGVAGPANGWPRGRRTPYPLPAHRSSHAAGPVMEAGRQLGLQWEPNALAVLSQAYDGRPGCNYCNNCGRGCPRRDKGSADVTFMRQALATGRCTLLTEAPVLRIVPGTNGRVREVEYAHRQGRHRIATRVLVLACGAIETPRRLLLTSGSAARNGLANESGQVGRHLMETLSWSSAGLHPQALGSHRGLPSELICWAHNAPDAIPGVVGGIRLSARTGEAGFTGPVAYAQRAITGWGADHKQRMRDAFGRMLAVGMVGESLPNAQTLVDLDPEQRDEFGQPLARIHAHLPDTELRRLEFGAQQCRAMLKAAGVAQLQEEYGSADFFSATHVFGTCRMGHDPAQSVVDQHGRAHAWKNLYIADASVFPSSGGGESPSLTVYALAIRTAARIRRALVGKEV